METSALQRRTTPSQYLVGGNWRHFWRNTGLQCVLPTTGLSNRQVQPTNSNIHPSLQIETRDTMTGSLRLSFIDLDRFATYPMFHWDAIVTAFHHDAADNLFPYNGTYDAESWWYSQVYSSSCLVDCSCSS